MFRNTLLTTMVLLSLCAAALAQAPVWRWDKDGDLKGWTPVNFESIEARGGMLRGVTKYNAMLNSPPVSLDASKYKVIEFRAQSSITDNGAIFWHGAGEVLTEQRMSHHVVLASSEPRVYRVDLSAYPEWKGIITAFRLDLVNAAGAKVAVDYVRFLERSLGVIPNAGFEDDFDKDGHPDGWTAQAGEFKLSEEHATEGTRTAMVATGEQGRAVLQTRVPLDELGVYRLDADLALVGVPTRVYATLHYRDVFGKPLADKPAVIEVRNLGPQIRLSGDFDAPRLAASADLSLVIEAPKARGWWDAVQLNHVAEPPDLASAPFETWRAHWIWAEATLNKDNVPAYLRKTFDLPVAPAQVTMAKVQVTADDTYEMFVNGKQVSSSTEVNGWRTPEMVDLKPYLAQGRNVIAVLARNVGSSAGFLLEGGVQWPGGSMDIASDDSWKAAGEAPEGWMASGFDDATWPVAHVIAAAGREPWGYLPYEYLGAREPVKLLKADLPKSVAAGSQITISALIDHLPKEAETNSLRFGLLREGQIVFGGAYSAGMAHATPGGTLLGPLSVTLTRFLPAGRYQVALGYPRTEYAAGQGIVMGTINVTAPTLAEKQPKVEIRPQGGLPTLFINGKPASFMHYLEIVNGAARITNMATNGLHLYEVDAVDIGWLGEGKFDYSAWDRKVLEILTYDPQALIMPTFDVSGLQHTWWMTGHDGELCRTESGSADVGIYGSSGKIISIASQKWREVSGDAVRRFTQHCQAAPYGTRIIGYQPCSGVSWEWQHWGSVGPFDPGDYSEPMQAAFREWVRKAYGNDVQKLQAAWRQPAISFETVKIPSVEQRDGPKDRVFRDPQQWQYVIDFYKFHQDVMVDGIEHYFRIIKEASDYKTIVGTYYGYEITMLSGARRAGDAGHFALLRLLNSKYCDFLMSPLDYAVRAVGESYTVMSPIGSVLAHNKLWVLQDDLRTHLVKEANQRAHGSPEGLAGTVSQLERGYAIANVKGAVTQWYDFSNGWIARDPRQGQIIGKLHNLDQQWVTWPNRGPDPNSVAVIVDEESPSAYMSHAFEVNFWAVYQQKMTFERMGAPFNFYLLKDVVSGKLPKFKCYFFLNCYKISDADRQWLVKNLQGEGRTLVWTYAPGYVNDTDLSAQRISELTGMKMEQRDEPLLWRMTLNPDNALGKDAADWQQPNFKITPAFIPQGEGEVAAVWEGTNLPALAIRKLPTWTSIYSGGPLLSPTVVKRIVQAAGVPVTVEGTDPSYVSRNLIGLHSAVPTTERLHFGRTVKVTDALTGEVLGQKVRDLDVKLEGPQTRLLKLDEVK